MDRAKEFHCELCQKNWKKWEPLVNHISKSHSDIQGELKGFPLRTNGRYVSIVKFVDRKKLDKNDDVKYVCDKCQQELDSKKDLEKHLEENHPGDQGNILLGYCQLFRCDLICCPY